MEKYNFIKTGIKVENLTSMYSYEKDYTKRLVICYDNNHFSDNKSNNIKKIIVNVNIQKSSDNIKKYTPKQIFNFNYVKSLLQKAVRQQETEIALKACKYMLSVDILKTIRRVLIIMVEDVCLFEKQFIELSWLTCQKEFTKHNYEWILGLVLFLCEYNTFDIFIGCRTKELDTSIKTRISYGGMKCDMEMLNNMTTGVYDSDIRLIDMNSINDLVIGSEELNKSVYWNAVDFHISDIDKRVSRLLGISEEMAKSIIWKYRSSINKRKNSYDVYLDNILSVLTVIDKIAKEILINFI